jgi:hypothetical protein
MSHHQRAKRIVNEKQIFDGAAERVQTWYASCKRAPPVKNGAGSEFRAVLKFGPGANLGRRVDEKIRCA